jgi:nicotinamide-nucleotide amidase
MNAVILTIGDEILIGQVVNTNAAFIGAKLAAAGIRVLRTSTVGDDRAGIDRELREAHAAADVVIVTGGLGPTHDDVTKRCMAEFFGVPLVHDPGQRQRISSLLESRGIAWNDAAEEQTMVPAGASLLPNRFGTAAGMALERSGRIVVALPGVPYEMEQIMADSVIPEARGSGVPPPGVEARVPPVPLGRPAQARRGRRHPRRGVPADRGGGGDDPGAGRTVRVRRGGR